MTPDAKKTEGPTSCLGGGAFFVFSLVFRFPVGFRPACYPCSLRALLRSET